MARKSAIFILISLLKVSEKKLEGIHNNTAGTKDCIFVLQSIRCRKFSNTGIQDLHMGMKSEINAYFMMIITLILTLTIAFIVEEFLIRNSSFKSYNRLILSLWNISSNVSMSTHILYYDC